MKTFLSIVVLFSCAATAQEQFDSAMTDLLEARDRRDALRVAELLRHQDPSLRAAAAVASGSVQDTSHLGLLAALLGDSSPEVRAASAFAIGQATTVVTPVQREHASLVLLTAMEREDEPAVLRAVLEALGKCGDEESLGRLLSLGQKWEDRKSLQDELALTVGRYGYRGIQSRKSAAFSAFLLTESQHAPWQAAYALMRIGVDSFLAPHAPALERTLENGNPDARMFAAAALGLTGSAAAVEPLANAAASDTDWRVRVSAARSLGQLRTARAIDSLQRLTMDPNEHVSLTALAGLAGSASGDGPALTVMLTSRTYSARQRGAAASALASLLRDSASTNLSASYRNGLLEETDYIRSLGRMSGEDPFQQLLSFSRSTDRSTQRAALEALVAMTKAVSDRSRRSRVTEALLDAVRSDDMAVMTVAADALGDSAFLSDRTPAVLLDRLMELDAPDDVEPMHAMIGTLGGLKSDEAIPLLLELLKHNDRTVALKSAEALEKIGGRSYLGEVPPRREPEKTSIDSEYLAGLHGAEVVVETEAGRFVFELLPEVAPFTCISFALLIENRFYDGLIFHRVVPNFVVQGGDPRGDGWGGPGFSIRSEFGQVGYERGMVGVASAGKDTEGCQFFVTHSKQPHLDGRYTIFGRVTEGMEVVDRIQAGEKIIRMRVEKRDNGE